MTTFANHRFRAVLVDIDGTLYDQRPLRTFMALELCLLPFFLRSWTKAKRTIGILRTFRHTREELRHIAGTEELCLEDWQYEATAKKAGVPTEEVCRVVTEWMYRRPLKYLKYCRRKGLEQFFTYATAHNMQIGVFSDYPAQEKIEALGLSEWVKLVLCATDKNINAFKPQPKGFHRACEEWNLQPNEVLYIGDRVEVDGEGAIAAGMPCIILDGTLPALDLIQETNRPLGITSFQGIQHALTSHC